MNRIHVCLVSGQPIPNLIPLRMDELRPDKIVLLVSPAMKVQADRLERVIRTWGVLTEKKPIAPYNLKAARETCMNLLVQYEKEDVILNATGGTKIMAFAAFEVFREMGRTILYVDTQDKRIDILSPVEKRIEFKSVMKVRPYLAAYGQNITAGDVKREISAAHSNVFHEIIKNLGKLDEGISLLNKNASQYLGLRTFPFISETRQEEFENETFRSVLDLFSHHKIVEVDNGTIVYPTLESVEFAAGGWLEEYVYTVVSSLHPTDVRMRAKVQWDFNRSGAPDNEYDVVFTMYNRLYLIECKTKRFVGRDIEHKGDDPVYKLDSLRDAAGGLFGKGMLVSYRKLSDQQKRRLTVNRLEYCDGPNLKNLRERIKKWIG